MFKQYIAIALIFFLTSAAQASLLRFDFTGLIIDNLPSTGGLAPSPIGGYLMLDSEAPDDRPNPDDARYVGAVVEGAVQWDGLDLMFPPGSTFSDVFVQNDNSSTNDLFAPVVGFEDATGTVYVIGLQLSDSTRSIFSDDSFPDSLSLSMFDAFQLDNANGTGIFMSVFGGPNAGTYQGGFTFAELAQVPAPGTAGLFFAALLAWRATRRGSVAS